MSIETLPTQEVYREASDTTKRNLGQRAAESTGATPYQIEKYTTSSSPLEKQIISGETYDTAITIAPKNFDHTPTRDEILYGMEVDHTVKHAPRLYDQLHDTSRQNMIKSDRHPEPVTESEAIDSLYEYLNTAILSYDDPRLQGIAKDLRETVTFIGEKEYSEAAVGIGEYWKKLLDENEDLRIYIPVGRIGNAQSLNHGGGNKNKSDDYLLDNILKSFSDDELTVYSDRILLSDEEIEKVAPENLKTVLLDDWTISGDQLKNAADLFIEDHPEYASSLEVQLITATRDKITKGLIADDYGADKHSLVPSIPIRAYFLAHDAKDTTTHSGAHITGAHSSVDYDFEEDLERINTIAKKTAKTGQIPSTLPPLYKVERPYRKRGITFTNTSRLAQAHKERKFALY